jgi:hypothetical protein
MAKINEAIVFLVVGVINMVSSFLKVFAIGSVGLTVFGFMTYYYTLPYKYEVGQCLQYKDDPNTKTRVIERFLFETKDYYVITIDNDVMLLPTEWNMMFEKCESSYYPKAKEVTYSQVLPIFETTCSTCHNPSFKNWMDFKTAHENAAKIKSRVWDLRTMPPAGVEMKESDRILLKDWVDSGAKE